MIRFDRPAAAPLTALAIIALIALPIAIVLLLDSRVNGWVELGALLAMQLPGALLMQRLGGLPLRGMWWLVLSFAGLAAVDAALLMNLHRISGSPHQISTFNTISVCLSLAGLAFRQFASTQSTTSRR